MRNTDLIDFQQSYLILISEVLAKHLNKLLTNQPDVRVIFLVNGSKGLINKKLTSNQSFCISLDIFTHELKLEKPNFEQRLKSFSNPLMADLADGLAFDDLSVFMERITHKSLHLDHDLEQELEALQGKSLKKTKYSPFFQVIENSPHSPSQVDPIKPNHRSLRSSNCLCGTTFCLMGRESNYPKVLSFMGLLGAVRPTSLKLS